MKQCKACPWRKDTKASRDIPNGYCARKHAALSSTLAQPGEFQVLHVMACHESPAGRERECVGWVAHQLGPGNNLALRWVARDGRYRELVLVGEQHETFEDTLESPTPSGAPGSGPQGGTAPFPSKR